MDNKRIKFIIIGFVGMLLISLFINLQIYTAKQSVQRERDTLKRENTSLAQKINESLKENKHLQERFNVVNASLDRVSQEKEEIQNKLDLLEKEKTELIKELEFMRQMPVVKEVERPVVSEDSYWGGVIKEKTALEFNLDNLRNELKKVEITNEQLQREKSVLELELNNLTRDKQDLKRQIEYNQKLMDTISTELVREKNDKFQIDEAFKTIKGENTVLRRQLRSLSSRKINLERRIAELQNDNRRMENRLNEMNVFLEDNIFKREKARELLESAEERERAAQAAESKEEPIELSPIVVRPQEAETEAQEMLELGGNILAVNKENNFVIINLGENSGIKIGDTFQVYREDTPIAVIEVIQIRKSISACDIEKEYAPIKTGDIFR